MEKFVLNNIKKYYSLHISNSYCMSKEKVSMSISSSVEAVNVDNVTTCRLHQSWNYFLIFKGQYQLHLLSYHGQSILVSYIHKTIYKITLCNACHLLCILPVTVISLHITPAKNNGLADTGTLQILSTNLNYKNDKPRCRIILSFKTSSVMLLVLQCNQYKFNCD